jgi:cell division protein FtsB
MFDFHEKRKMKAILYSKGVFVLLILIAVLLSVSVYNRFVVTQDTKIRLNERREDLESLEMRAEVLQTKVDYLESDRGIEEELRNRFDVAKEGERVIVILEDKEKKSDNKDPEVDDVKEDESSGLMYLLKLLKFW